jgi:hypothetical protein
MASPTTRAGISLVWAGLLLMALPAIPAAHEIPPSVTVITFVKPEGQRLRVLVRVPLEAMRDLDFPLTYTGYLDIARVDSLLPGAARLWIADYLEFYENGRRLDRVQVVATRIALPSDRSFESWGTALANLGRAPLPEDSGLPWQQALLDVLLEYPITADSSRFAVEPALAHLGIRTSTVLRFLPPGRGERVLQYPGNPGLVQLDPRWHQAALHFIKLGFFHILDGVDHLLFVFCLVIPFRRFRSLVAIVTSFTVAHSITLIASAMGMAPNALWFPPLIETLIALSIVFMAFENIVGAKLERRWLIAFAFGLVHGFGFSFILRDSLQFAGSHLTTSLLAFNVGVELGQVLVVAVAIPVLALSFRYVVAERIGTILLSALVAHTAWHWMLERGSALREYRFQWPALDATLLLGVTRALMLILVLVGAMWLVYGLVGRLNRPRGAEAHSARSES